jgi:hypothetical protein
MSKRNENNSRDDKRERNDLVFFFVFQIYIYSPKRQKKMIIKKRDDCPEKNEKKASGIIFVRSTLSFNTIYSSTFK